MDVSWVQNGKDECTLELKRSIRHSSQQFDTEIQDMIFEEDYTIRWQSEYNCQLFSHRTNKIYTFSLEGLGAGGFGTVYTLCRVTDTNKSPTGLVLKRIHKDDDRERQIVEKLHEYPVCCIVRQRYFSACGDYVYYVMDQLDGDMVQFMELYRRELLSDHTLSTTERDVLFKDTCVYITNEIRRKFVCILSYGYRYFDIKLENIGYILTSRNGKTYMRLSILDIGSMTIENWRTNRIGTYTHEAPEWSNKNVQWGHPHRQIVRIDLVHRAYVWLLGLLLLTMLEFHPDDSISRQVTYVVDSRVHKRKMKMMVSLFPREQYGMICTSLNVDPFSRHVQLGMDWRSEIVNRL
jgi:serine/threonine protein kinase